MLNLQGLVAASAVGQTGGDGSIVVALAILLVVVIVALVRKKRRLKALSQAAATTETIAPETQPAAQQSAPARPDGNRTRRGRRARARWHFGAGCGDSNGHNCQRYW